MSEYFQHYVNELLNSIRTIRSNYPRNGSDDLKDELKVMIVVLEKLKSEEYNRKNVEDLIVAYNNICNMCEDVNLHGKGNEPDIRAGQSFILGALMPIKGEKKNIKGLVDSIVDECEYSRINVEPREPPEDPEWRD